MIKKYVLRSGILALAFLGLVFTLPASASTTNIWAQESSSGTYLWKSIAASSDGMKLVAVRSGGISTSTDGGVTWVVRSTLTHTYTAVASSDDGTHLVAVASDGIYTSTDSGVTWVTRTMSTRYWAAVASDSTGKNLVAGTFSPVGGGGGSYLATSTDYGAHWVDRISDLSGRSWASIASSSDGTKLVAVAAGEFIYTSTNGGVSWIAQTAPVRHNWFGVTSSSDGVKLAAVDQMGYIYTSTNSGSVWTMQSASGARNWFGIASSDSGTKLVAVAKGSAPYVSIDGGLSWAVQVASGSGFVSVTSSSDGSRFAALDAGVGTTFGTAWIFPVPPPPACVISTPFTATPATISSGSSSSLSWGTTGCTSVTISGGGMSGVKPMSSSGLTTGARTSTTVYVLTATNGVTPVTQAVTVTVTTTTRLPCVINSFAASPTSVSSGASSTLIWSTSNCTSVSVSGPGVSSTALSSSVSTGPITAPSSYTLNATDGTVSLVGRASVTITTLSGLCRINSFTATPPSIATGRVSSLAWSTTGCAYVKITGFSGTFPPNSAGMSTGSLSATRTYKLTAY